MRADEHDLLGLRAAANFPDDLVALVGAAAVDIEPRGQGQGRSVAEQPGRAAPSSRSIIIMGCRFCEPSDALCRARRFDGRDDM